MKHDLVSLKSAFQTDGLDGGLHYLNRPIDHRYTAVYRLREMVLSTIAIVDKQGEVTPDFLAEVSLEDSFCQFVMRDGLFRTNHSGEDGRLNGHKYQGVMLSYTGVPLMDDRGELYGTLCHFDALQRTLRDEDFEFLQRAARLMPAYLPL